MRPRRERTIEKSAEVTGVGFFTGADVTVRFLPAPEGRGLRFQRVDLPGAPVIPALIEWAVQRERRTALGCGTATVELVEHVLAALAGLHVDNCLIQVNAPELPGCDGSALPFVEALHAAGLVEQTKQREVLHLDRPLLVSAENHAAEICAQPGDGVGLQLGYHLSYSGDAPIGEQTLSLNIDPQVFLDELAFARTFVLEREVDFLRSRGYGLRVTARDLLVFGPDGVIDNTLRRPDECVRHKMLDCLGDFALLGCDLSGQVFATRTGHELNREFVRRLRAAYPQTRPAADLPPADRIAA